MENSDYKSILSNFGIALVVAGIPIMLMEHYDYFVPGLLITIIGFILLVLSIFIKTDFQEFFSYLEKAQVYAEKKSKTPIIWEDSFNLKKESKLNPADLTNFIHELSNAFGCFYEKEFALKINDIFSGFYKPKLQLKNTVDEKMNEIKKAYELISNDLLFRIYFPASYHHPTNCNPKFEPSQLKLYSNFLVKRTWRIWLIEKIRVQIWIRKKRKEAKKKI